MAVTEGTASALNVSSVAMAAKTGTAEIGSGKKYVNSWVIGFFPYENPRYAFAIVMEKGPYSNLVGAPSVMRQLIDWLSIYTPEYLR
jgi:penicillin-binding protein 2